MPADSKIMTLEDFLGPSVARRRAGKRLVFTNGCFDILHAGHVHYLQAARAQGDLLLVGLNSDRSVSAIKGDRRPIVGQDHRAAVLAGIGYVDFVILFDEPDPLRLIKAVRPDVLVKGDDWPEEQIVGAGFVKAGGGRVVRVPVLAGISTSTIIEKIIRTCC